MVSDDEEIQEETYNVTVRRNVRTGVVISEVWEKDGKSHREGGPAQIRRDAETGIVVREAWIRDNQYDRVDGPAVILRKALTGKVYSSAWFKNGEKIAPPPRSRRGPRASSSPQGPAGTSGGPGA